MTRPAQKPFWKRLDRELQVPQGEVLPYLLEHAPGGRQDADVWADGRLCLRLRAETGVLHAGEVVCHAGHSQGDLARFSLERVHADAALEVWQAVFPRPFAGPLDYYFRLQTATGRAYLGATGLQGSLPLPARFRFRPELALDVPVWARGATFYQIFPDRFHRVGTPDPGLHPWAALPTAGDFKGGNLAGITAKLETLCELGVEVLYLTPVFTSPSTHRYDTLDFFTVDPRLGTLHDLQALVARAHRLGLRVILDGVFNHVSERHPFFQDVRACGPASPYWHWFEVQSWPIEDGSEQEPYSMWWGHAQLPELRVEHPEVQAYLRRVATYWVEAADIDGWRLDVAGELPASLCRALRQAVRRVKPDAYLLGEYWGDARPFVQGDSFDATMNYPFRRSVLGFLTGEWDAPALARHLSRLYHQLPRAAAEAQYNLLGSHDVPRLMHELGGREDLVRLAFALQSAYPGAPALYYGDEVGLTGGHDPDCRGAYPWDGQGARLDLRASIQRLYRARRGNELLRTGEFRCWAEGPDTVLIERRLGEQTLSLCVNRAQGRAEWSPAPADRTQMDRAEPNPSEPNPSEEVSL